MADKRLYSKYVNPNSRLVKELTLNSCRFLKNDKLFRGYTSKDDVYDEVRAIYNAVLDYGINYQLPPAGGLYLLTDSLDISQQRLRLVDEVLTDRKGTCIDLSLLFSSLLEEVGLNPIIIFIEGHAFTGVFLDNDDYLINGICDNLTKIYNDASVGVNKILLFETTYATINNQADFKTSVDYAFKTLSEYNKKTFAAIDIRCCHNTIFKPLPLNASDELLELEESDVLVSNSNDKTNIIETKILSLDSSYKKDRFSFWGKKLLDLSEQNPLVDFKQNLSNCIKLKAKSPIYNLLKENDKLKLYSISKTKKNDIIAKSQEELFKTYDTNDSYINELSIDDKTLFSIGYDSTLKSLLKKNQLAVEETGAQTLYLCLGILEYKTKKEDIGHAPFILLPINIVKDKYQDLYNVSYDYDNIMLNETFFEYYKINFGTSFDGFYSLVKDNNYLDIVRTFKESQTKIKLIENSYFIANLTFSHYIMWLDIKKRQEELKENKIISSIINSKNLLDEVIMDYDIETNEKYEDFASPLPYDSTQLKAILSCGDSKSFILDGPPGTGKSQTIVNMIVNAFYQGKKVLFVAEKKAALDVVYKRLKKIGLDRFSLELHSNKASKSEFFTKLGETIEFGQTEAKNDFLALCYKLDSKKEEIINSIKSIKENKYYMSLYDSIVFHIDLKNKYDFS